MLIDQMNQNCLSSNRFMVIQSIILKIIFSILQLHSLDNKTVNLSVVSVLPVTEPSLVMKMVSSAASTTKEAKRMNQISSNLC